LIPAVSAAAPLAVIPAVTSRYGANAWASVAIALSVGNAAAVLAELGWGVVGPQRVARERRRQRSIFMEALASKLIGLIILAPTAAGITYFIASGDALAAAALAFATVLGALSPAWYFIGLGRPMTVLAVDTLPRVAFAVSAAVIISSGGPLVAYGLCMLAAAVVGYLLTALLAKTPILPTLRRFRQAPKTIRRQLVIVVGRGISTLYTALPTAFLGVVSPFSVATFSAVDRPMRMGLTIIAAVPNRLQSWIGTPDLTLTRKRSQQSLKINGLLGAVAGGVFAIITPTVAEWLFTGTISVSYLTSSIGGLLVFVICTSRGFGLALVAAGRANQITSAIIAAAVVGTVALLVLGYIWGTNGALVALVIAECVGLAVQGVILRRAWQSEST
jgi:O-antigen/teichoic acid export membrane protein